MIYKFGFMVLYTDSTYLFVHHLITGEINETKNVCVMLDARDGHLEPDTMPCIDLSQDEIWKYYAECSATGCQFK